MSAPTTAHCPLGLTPDDLSAWRDHTLPSDEEQRITAHLATCPTCQRIIAADEAIAATLAANQPPAPDAQNWQRLQARIAANTPSTVVRRHSPRRALWSGLAAAAAVLLISALFFNLFGQLALRRGANSHHKTTVASTPPVLASVPPTAPILGPQLNWQNQSAPVSVVPPPGNQTMVSNFAYAPTDARTAYICSFEGSANLTTPISIWATHDSATTWKHVSDIPFTGYDLECLLTVDAHNPQQLSLAIWGQNAKTYKNIAVAYVSDDGAQTWRTLSDAIMMSDRATQGQMGVALTSPIANVSDVLHYQPNRLSITHDGWRTWSVIDGSLVAQGYFVSQVWLRPADSALLAEVAPRQMRPINGSSTPSLVPLTEPTPTSLWQSVDLGAHWTPLPAPPNLIAKLGFVVAQPQGNLPWRACGLTRSGAGKTLSQLIGCTVDGGQTWTSRPLPTLSENCGNGCIQQQIVGGWGVALMSDDSLLSIFYAGPTDPSVQQTLSMYHIFRLAPHATQWQDLGSSPNSGIIALDTAPTGTLVSVSGGGSLGGVSGSIVGHLGGDIPNRGVFASATLP